MDQPEIYAADQQREPYHQEGEPVDCCLTQHVVLFLLVRDGRVLMEWRTYNGYEGWVFPGGKLEAEDIDPLEGMRREFQEEIGRKIKAQVVHQLPEFVGYGGWHVYAFVTDDDVGYVPDVTQDAGHRLGWIAIQRVIESKSTMWSTTHPVIIKALTRVLLDGIDYSRAMLWLRDQTLDPTTKTKGPDDARRVDP